MPLDLTKILYTSDKTTAVHIENSAEKKCEKGKPSEEEEEVEEEIDVIDNDDDGQNQSQETNMALHFLVKELELECSKVGSTLTEEKQDLQETTTTVENTTEANNMPLPSPPPPPPPSPASPIRYTNDHFSEIVNDMMTLRSGGDPKYTKYDLKDMATFFFNAFLSMQIGGGMAEKKDRNAESSKTLNK